MVVLVDSIDRYGFAQAASGPAFDHEEARAAWDSEDRSGARSR
jgi:hypothetical protein